METTDVKQYGGRAMCPADEYGDLELREEMIWHAIEEALADAGWLEWSRDWYVPWQAVVEVVPSLTVGRQVTPGITVFGHRLTLHATTDDHLGNDASGLVDLTATLVSV